MKVLLEEIKLVAYAFFEVITEIDIKVANWIMLYLCVVPQPCFGFLSGAYWGYGVKITYLEQDRATDVTGIFHRPIFVSPNSDTRTGFIDKTLRCEFAERVIRIWSCH